MQKTLTIQELSAGQELPDLDIEVNATLVAGGALAQAADQIQSLFLCHRRLSLLDDVQRACAQCIGDTIEIVLGKGVKGRREIFRVQIDRQPVRQGELAQDDAATVRQLPDRVAVQVHPDRAVGRLPCRIGRPARGPGGYATL